MTGDRLNLLLAMVDWEEGNLPPLETVALFALLIRNGMAFRLQGCYGRQAMAFVEAGLIGWDGKVDWARTYGYFDESELV